MGEEKVTCSKCDRLFTPSGTFSGKPMCPNCLMDTTETLAIAENPPPPKVGNADPFSTQTPLKATSRIRRGTSRPSGRHKVSAKDKTKPRQRSRANAQADPVEKRSPDPLKMTMRNRIDGSISKTGRYRIGEITRRQKSPGKDHSALILAITTSACAVLLDLLLLLFYLPFVTTEGVDCKIASPLRRPAEKSLEEIFRLPDEQIDLGTAALLVAKEDYEETFQQRLDVEQYLKILDQMAATIQSRIQDTMEPEQVITAISHYLYDEQKFATSQNGWDPGNLYLNMILDGRQGYCLGFAEMWLALAERIEWQGKPLPIYGVLVPFHIFCRWDDGNYRRNIETLHVPPTDPSTVMLALVSEWLLGKSKLQKVAGRNIPDAFYRTNYQITDQSIANNVYLHNIPKKAVIGCIYSNRCGLQLDRLESLKEAEQRAAMIEKARRDVATANRWYPKNVIGIRSQAFIYSEWQGEHEKAIEILTALEAVDPTAVTLYLLGNAHTHTGNYEKAIEYFDKAREAKAFRRSTLSHIPYAKARAYCEWGKYEEAEEFCENFLRQEREDMAATVLVLKILGRVYNRHGKRDKAVQCAWRLQNILGGKSEEVIQAWGEIHRYKENWEKARASYEEVLKWYNPASSNALYGLGLYWKYRKEYRQAMSCFQQAIMYDRNFKEAKQELSEVRRLLVISERLGQISKRYRKWLSSVSRF